MLIAAAAIVFAAVVCIVYRIAYHSPARGRREDMHAIPGGEQYRSQQERMHALIDDLAAVSWETWEIRSDDGLKLAARYHHAGDGAPVQIMMHGYRGSAVRDFCGGARIAMEDGYSVLLVDQRANGKSGGHTITFGVKERYDCLAWVREVIRRCGDDVRIVLSGVSMGASTVLMATALPLPENVVCVVADCPFSTPAEIIRKVCADMGLPVGAVMPLAHLSAMALGGFRLNEASALEAVKRKGIPVLLIHGEDDRFVPCEMSLRMHAANPERVQLMTVPGAGHGLSYIVDTPRYERTVRRFLRENG